MWRLRGNSKLASGGAGIGTKQHRHWLSWRHGKRTGGIGANALRQAGERYLDGVGKAMF
jgi:hypothetical protein